MNAFHLFLILGYLSLEVPRTTCKKVATITLYTNLVDIIGKNETCENQREENSTAADDIFRQPGVVMSNYKFHYQNSVGAIIGQCDVIDVSRQRFSTTTWACFTIKSSTSKDANWFFVDCQSVSLLTISCLRLDEILKISENLCGQQSAVNNKISMAGNKSCHVFSYGIEESTVCSTNFRFQTTVYQRSAKEAGTSDLEDTIAYLCVAFILITFLISVLVPSEKCKPTYKYDKEAALRVPLEIYEMYGVNYKPSAKKKRARRNTAFPSQVLSQHSLNVAAIANNPVSWKSSHIMESDSKELTSERPSVTFDPTLDRRKSSTATEVDSTAAGYKNFRDQLEASVQEMTSEKKSAVSFIHKQPSGSCTNPNYYIDGVDSENKGDSLRNSEKHGIQDSERSVPIDTTDSESIHRFKHNEQNEINVASTVSDVILRNICKDLDFDFYTQYENVDCSQSSTRDQSMLTDTHRDTRTKYGHVLPNYGVVNDGFSDIDDKGMSEISDDFMSANRNNFERHNQNRLPTEYDSSESSGYPTLVRPRSRSRTERPKPHFKRNKRERALTEFDTISEQSETGREDECRLETGYIAEHRDVPQTNKCISITVSIPSNFDFERSGTVEASVRSDVFEDKPKRKKKARRKSHGAVTRNHRKDLQLPRKHSLC